VRIIALAALVATCACVGACGPTWKDVSRAVAAGPVPEREPLQDRRRSYYDREATRPRSELQVLLMPDGSSVKHGLERQWAADGTLQVERRWSHGEPDGWWRTWWRYDVEQPTTMRWWYSDGTPSSEGPALNGLREGRWRGWHPDGTPAFEGGYVAGRRSGPWTYWHPDGSLAERGTCVDDRREGTWERFAAGERPGLAPAWDVAPPGEPPQ
jgi:hypothetical protein